MLFSSFPAWDGEEELIDIAFFGVQEFSVCRLVPGLKVESGPEEEGGLRRFLLQWDGGMGYVIAESVDVDISHRNPMFFPDKWGIKGGGSSSPWGGG